MKENTPLINLHWYALKVFFNRVFYVEDYFKQQGIDCYIPCETVSVTRKDGHKHKVRKPAISSLLFFRSTEQQAIEVQAQLRGQVSLYTRCENMSKRPIVISDKEMNVFMLVSSSGDKGLEYFGNDDIKFRKGDYVQVTDGCFKGLEGYVCRIKGDRRLVIEVQGVCAVATSYIPQCFLRKVQEP